MTFDVGALGAVVVGLDEHVQRLAANQSERIGEVAPIARFGHPRDLVAQRPKTVRIE